MGSCDSGINENKWARRSGLKLRAANNARSMRFKKSRPRSWTAVKSKPLSTHGRGLFSPVSEHQKKSLCQQGIFVTVRVNDLSLGYKFFILILCLQLEVMNLNQIGKNCYRSIFFLRQCQQLYLSHSFGSCNITALGQGAPPKFHHYFLVIVTWSSNGK